MMISRSSSPAGLYAAAVTGRTAYGPNAGRRVTRVGDQIDPESMDFSLRPRCATVDGFSLHANVAVHADDRPRLERLARYCARAPIALDRLERLLDGRLLYRFKRPWRDGTTPIVMEPLELLSTELLGGWTTKESATRSLRKDRRSGIGTTDSGYNLQGLIEWTYDHRIKNTLS